MKEFLNSRKLYAPDNLARTGVTDNGDNQPEKGNPQSTRMLQEPTTKTISDAYDSSAESFYSHRLDPEDKFNLLAWPTISVLINGSIAGGVVADLGCGPGEVTQRFSKFRGKPSLIYGFDASQKMIDIAKANYTDQNLKFEVADISKIPLEDESVDLAFASYSLLHAVDLGKTLQDIQRILKPGGKVMILEPHEQRFQHYYENSGGVGYFTEGWYLETFLGLADNSQQVYVPTFYRRTKSWIKEITKAGLEFIDYHEPRPTEQMIESNHPIWQDYQKCMRMIIFEARKN